MVCNPFNTPVRQDTHARFYPLYLYYVLYNVDGQFGTFGGRDLIKENGWAEGHTYYNCPTIRCRQQRRMRRI